MLRFGGVGRGALNVLAAFRTSGLAMVKIAW